MTLVNTGVSIKTMLFNCTPMTYFVDVMSAFILMKWEVTGYWRKEWVLLAGREEGDGKSYHPG